MKGIDKKACRDFLDIGLRIDPNNGLLRLEQVEYIIRTAVKIVGHRRLLILYLYDRQDAAQGPCAPAYTVFQASDTFVTYNHTSSTKTKWRTSMLWNLSTHHYRPDAYRAFYTKADEQRVISFCKGGFDNGFTALSHFQQAIRNKETLRRQHNRQRKIIAEFRGVRPLPKDLDVWLRREVMPAYFFYDYQKGKTLTKGVCSACGQEMELERVRHNAEGKCPCCGRDFTMKSERKRGFLFDRVTASVVQRYRGNEVIVRTVKAYCHYPKGKTCELTFHEKIREIIRQNNEGDFQVLPFYHTADTSALTPWKKGYPPVLYFNQYGFNNDTCGYLYCENLNRELRGTPWQYCQLGAFYRGIHDRMEVSPYLTAFRKIPAIEFFVKLGLYWLATYVVYHRDGEKVINVDGKSLRDVLQIEPSDLPLLQKSGARVEDLILLRILRKEGHQPTPQFFDWLIAHEVVEVNCLERALHYTTPHKLMRYLDQQFTELEYRTYRRCNGVLIDYKDYLGFCEQLGYDLTNEFVLFPRDLQKAHDQAQDLMKLHQVEKYDASIAALQPDLKRQYQFSADGLVVLPPGSAQEIVQEGQNLHHCVGGYVENMVKQRCTMWR